MDRPRDARATLRAGDGHRPSTPADIERTLAGAIEAAVARYPDRPAVRARGASLTYAALDRAANRVAHDLVAGGIGPAEPVAIMAGQGLELVVGIVGILKAGAAYVPLDPTHPLARSAATVADVGARVVVADPASRRSAASLVDEPVVASAESGGPEHPPVRVDDPDALAYVYFTSGSTGRPKGVMDTHRNVLDNVRRYTDSLGIGPGDRLSLVQTVAFSGAVSSLFAALVNGACSYPFDVRSAGMAGLRAWARAERLTMFHGVPVLVRALTDHGRPFPDLRVVRLEGDAATWSDVSHARPSLVPGTVIVNGLGMTETGLVRQFFVDHDTPLGSGSLPLGYPVPGVDVVIEDDEIVVLGRHVAVGYWGEAERTAAAFADVGDGRRSYRTGDLGLVEPDGRLIGLGRRDFAAKIRGETVDLAEVEAALRAAPGVADAVAMTRRDGGGEPRLVAYVVPVEGRGLDRAMVRRTVAKVLAGSAVPSTLVPIPAVPLDPSGKIDRASLPVPGRERPELAVPYVPPRTPLERRLVDVWERLLDVHPIGVHDAFFDLGGDSLDAARLVSELATMAPDRVADDVVLDASTVDGLAARLSEPGPAVPVWHAIHSRPGDAGYYTRVAQAAAGAIELRQVAPSPAPDGTVRISALADEAVARIRHRSAVGPYRILGFCFNAPVALEVANRLQADGHTVATVALLGISPLELPTLVDRAALAAPDRARRFRQRARTHLSEMGRLGAHGAIGYLIERIRARRERMADDLRGVRTTSRLRAEAVRVHVAQPFDGRVIVVLGRGSATLYTRAPARAWRRIGREVEVILLHGDDHAMLVEPEATRLAQVLIGASAGVPGVPAAPVDLTADLTAAGSVAGQVP